MTLTNREVSKAIADGDPIYTVEYVGGRWEQFGCVYYRRAIAAQEAADKAVREHDAMRAYVCQVGGTAGMGGKRMHWSLTRLEEHAPYCTRDADHLDACCDSLA